MQVARSVLRYVEWRTAEDHVGTCLWVGDNTAKAVLIPHTLIGGHPLVRKPPGEIEELATYQLVGGVTAHQGDDG